MIPVVMSGGSGTRLWPVSRGKLPKQFCEIFDDSLQNLTVKRLAKLGSPWTITSLGLRDLTIRTLMNLNLPTDQVIYEPFAKNTAPAIATLCFLFQQKGMGEEILGVFPADHLIEKPEEFYKAITLAEKEAKTGKIVTLGIQPDHPATGFGYIETDSKTKHVNGTFTAYGVKSFHEKPSLEKAQTFIQSGGFYWNAGIFVFKVSAMIEAFNKLQPKMWQTISGLKADLSNLNEIYSQVENISIDYAIMEKLSTSQLSCVPCEIGWSDVGSWDAVADLFKGKKADHVIAVGAKNNFAFSTQDKKYAFVGVEDLIVVDTADATLITQKGATQRVKDVVDTLKIAKSKLADEHVYEHRPWGKYEILRDQENFKSKVIHVLPKQQLSLQSHTKREEHWLITKGHGEVVLNDEVIPVKPGTYIKIPLGAKHRMRNPGNEVVEFVEVQMGSYFGEDDIIRYQDDYKRT